MASRQISVEQLKFGMYIAQLDRPWTDTPFTFQGFVLRNDRQVETLRKFCTHVYVDPEKSDRGSWEAAFAAATAAGQGAYRDQATVETELKAAQRAYDDYEKALNDSFASLRAGGELDVEELKKSVGLVTSSVVRNADAVLLLTQLREKGDYELKRGLETSVLMIAFARFLQLEREALDLLGLAGALLDIGKVRVSDEILKKRSPLSPEELEEAKRHVMHSAELIKPLAGMPADVVRVVMLHHERQDGSGYPLGVAGNDIGMHGSMAAIADTFSALTSARPYAPQMSPSNALGLLYKSRETLFHAALVEQFIQCIGIYPVGSVVELNSGEIAVVIAQNRIRRLQPRVMVILDREWKPLRPQKVLDLMREPKAAAGEPYRIQRTIEASRLPLDPKDFFL